MGLAGGAEKVAEFLVSIPIQGTKQNDSINSKVPFPAVHLSCCLSDFQPLWN